MVRTLKQMRIESTRIHSRTDKVIIFVLLEHGNSPISPECWVVLNTRYRGADHEGCVIIRIVKVIVRVRDEGIAMGTAQVHTLYLKILIFISYKNLDI